MVAVTSFGFATVLLLLLSSPVTSCSEQEMGSLLWFLAGLSPQNGLTTTWQNGTDCCKWEGITCGAEGMVAEVSLASRGLEGSISPSLAGLTNLMRLNLSYNSLSGGLPSELLASNTIVLLDVSFNHLSQVLGSGAPLTGPATLDSGDPSAGACSACAMRQPFQRPSLPLPRIGD